MKGISLSRSRGGRSAAANQSCVSAVVDGIRCVWGCCYNSVEPAMTHKGIDATLAGGWRAGSVHGEWEACCR